MLENRVMSRTKRVTATSGAALADTEHYGFRTRMGIGGHEEST
jgi:hypothetical protein